MSGNGDVAVRIAEARSDRLSWTVRNGGVETVWLIVDQWFVWRRDRNEITLSFARGRLRSGVEPFGYFAPEVESLPSGGCWQGHLSLAWPLAVSRLWNGTDEISLPSGEYQLSVEMGFGRTPQPPPPSSGAEGEDVVLGWQQVARSAPVALCVRQSRSRGPL